MLFRSVASTLALGNVRTNTAATLGVANTVITNALYQDSLAVAATTTLGNVLVASPANIAAGQSDVVGVAIGNAGSLTGTIVLGLTSKAAAAGLTDLALASKSVAVTGAAYDLAKADLSTTTLTLGNVRVADVATVEIGRAHV